MYRGGGHSVDYAPVPLVACNRGSAAASTILLHCLSLHPPAGWCCSFIVLIVARAVSEAMRSLLSSSAYRPRDTRTMSQHRFTHRCTKLFFRSQANSGLLPFYFRWGLTASSYLFTEPVEQKRFERGRSSVRPGRLSRSSTPGGSEQELSFC